MRGRPFLAVAGACAALVAAPAEAYAGGVAFDVDSPTDAADSKPGDHVCDVTPPGDPRVCSLRAALTEAAAAAGSSVIFNSSMNGQTIDVVNGTLNVPANVPVNACSSVTNPAMPCVGLRQTGVAGVMSAAGGASIRGFAIKSESTALRVAGNGGTVANNWFGAGLDGSRGTNETGLQLFASGAVVGGTQPSDRNVFAHNVRALVITAGGDNNTIVGNYFGTNADGKDTPIPPSGTAPPSNHDDIEIAQSTSADESSGTVIGATVAEPFASSPQCDGGCNLISRAAAPPMASDTGVGIDLSGEPANLEFENTANTTIKGNFIGLDVNGTLNYANQAAAIVAAGAANTVVGGPTLGDRNYISGGHDALLHGGDETATLEVRNNFIGLNSAGTAAFPSDTALIRSAQIGSGGGLTVVGNRLAGTAQTPLGVQVAGNGGVIRANAFGIGTGGQALGFGDTAIRLLGQNGTIGGMAAGDGNVIGHNGGPGVLIDGGDGYDVVGNLIGTDAGGADRGNAGAGITIRNLGADAGTGNVIGGDTPESENVISHNGSDAVEIAGSPGAEAQRNTVKRNRGTGNAGLFVDLGVTGPGDQFGTNGGIQPPVITAATTTGASGSAGAGQTVRVFRAGGTAGSIEGFEGQAVADGSGGWSVDFAAPLAEGQLVTAGATDALGNSSEYAQGVATTSPPAPPQPPGGEAGGDEPGGAQQPPVQVGDTTRPTVTVAVKPSAFPAARNGDSISSAGRRTGTTVTYRLSESARAAFIVERATTGRRVGRRCRRATRSNRARRKCTLYVRVRGGFAHSGAAGTNRFHFTGRIRRRTLRAGRYRLVAQAADSAGNRSTAKRRAFRIVR